MKSLFWLFSCVILAPGFSETGALLASPLALYHSHNRRGSLGIFILPPTAERLGRQRTRRVLTTTPSNDDLSEPLSPPQGPIQRAVRKFRARPGTYLLIPCVAAVVGWFTNWLAVQMIFYPIEFRGIPIKRWKEVPLGLLGWQGIVPCKTRPMTEAMVEMVSTQLMSIKEVFGRLDPRHVADLLAPRVPVIMKEVLREIVPAQWMVGVPGAIFNGLDTVSQGIMQLFNHQFLVQLTKAMQANIEEIFSLRNCVVDQMMMDRAKLGELFRKCGQKELDFLTNSGLWFGFLLGLIQMTVALFWENPWSLSIGGGIVGLATNWLALKWIFEPVDPTRIGPFVLQGKFLRRQPEVAREFSKFFANNILTSDKLWTSVLTDPETSPAFGALFTDHFSRFVKRVTRGLGFGLEPETLQLAANKAIDKLPAHVPVLYEYMDKKLALETTLRQRMEKMTSRQFERVLHPIFEEDELTLILAGAALGFAAGLVQQGLETGAIKVPNLWTPTRKYVVLFVKEPRAQTKKLLVRTQTKLQNSGRKLRQCFTRPFAFKLRNRKQVDEDESMPDGDNM